MGGKKPTGLNEEFYERLLLLLDVTALEVRIRRRGRGRRRGFVFVKDVAVEADTLLELGGEDAVLPRRGPEHFSLDVELLGVAQCSEGCGHHPGQAAQHGHRGAQSLVVVHNRRRREEAQERREARDHDDGAQIAGEVLIR